MKHTYEDRLKAVLSVLEDGKSFNTVVREKGIAKTMFSLWIALYKEFGSAGLCVKNGYYSRGFKVPVVQYMLENNMSIFKKAINLAFLMKR